MTLDFEYAVISQLDRYRREGILSFNVNWWNMIDLYAIHDIPNEFPLDYIGLYNKIKAAIISCHDDDFLELDLNLDDFTDN